MKRLYRSSFLRGWRKNKNLIDELSSLLRVLEEDCSILGEDTICMDEYFKVISGGEISQI